MNRSILYNIYGQNVLANCNRKRSKNEIIQCLTAKKRSLNKRKGKMGNDRNTMKVKYKEKKRCEMCKNQLDESTQRNKKRVKLQRCENLEKQWNTKNTKCITK